jgi:hypothetical protein
VFFVGRGRRPPYLVLSAVLIATAVWGASSMGILSLPEAWNKFRPFIFIALGLILAARGLSRAQNSDSKEYDPSDSVVVETPEGALAVDEIWKKTCYSAAGRAFTGGRMRVRFGRSGVQLRGARFPEGDHTLEIDASFARVDIYTDRFTPLRVTARTRMGAIAIFGTTGLSPFPERTHEARSFAGAKGRLSIVFRGSVSNFYVR